MDWCSEAVDTTIDCSFADLCFLIEAWLVFVWSSTVLHDSLTKLAAVETEAMPGPGLEVLDLLVEHEWLGRPTCTHAADDFQAGVCDIDIQMEELGDSAHLGEMFEITR